MLRIGAEPQRELKEVTYDADLVIVGGGMAGSCCAITAARRCCNAVKMSPIRLLSAISGRAI